MSLSEVKPLPQRRGRISGPHGNPQVAVIHSQGVPHESR